MLRDKLRNGLIVGAIVGLVGAILSYCRPQAVEGLERVTYDMRARWSMDPKRADPRIVMVDVDDLDLAWALRGQGGATMDWPWPRQLFGMATEHLLKRGARAVVFDFLFNSPGNWGRDDPEKFGKSLGAMPRTVVGLKLSKFSLERPLGGTFAGLLAGKIDCEAARRRAYEVMHWGRRAFSLPRPDQRCDLWIGGEDTLAALKFNLGQLKDVEQFEKQVAAMTTFRALTPSELAQELTALKLAARRGALELKAGTDFHTNFYPHLWPPLIPVTQNTRLGVVTQKEDTDGIFRRYAPVARYAGKLYPSLGLAAAMVAFPKQKVSIKDGHVHFGTKRIPTDDQGRASIRYHGSGDAYSRVGIRHILNVVVQQKQAETFKKRIVEVRNKLGARVRDEGRLPTVIRSTLAALWQRLQKAGCGIALRGKRLAILQDLSAQDTWHTLRVQWAAEELSKAKAKHESCGVDALGALAKIKAYRQKWSTNYKHVKAHITEAETLKYPSGCAAAMPALATLKAVMNEKKSAPKRALETFQAWGKITESKACEPVIDDTLSKRLLESDKKLLARFKGYPGLRPGSVKGRIFIVHAFAAALRDLKPSPVDPQHLGGEINASFLDNLLHGDFIRRSPKWISAFTAMLLCLLLGLGTFLVTAVTRSAAWVAVLSMAISLLVVSVFGYAAYQFYDTSGAWLDVVLPSLSGLLAWAAALGANFYLEGKSRRFVQDALGRYTAPALVKELMSNPKALTLGWGAKRELTVFFSDLQNFTSISERLTAEQLVHLLNDYLTEMTDIILESGGIVDKYIGDAIMAFWGAPYDDPDHAMNACRATLKMQARIKELKEKWLEEYNENILARCGLNTGQAVAGNMGSKHKFNYTLMGDTVNLASRFEGANKPYSTLVMIGENTRTVVKDQMVTRELDFMAVKGKEQPVRVFELICQREDSNEKTDALVERFTEALDVYRQTKFKEALDLFHSIMDDYDGDGPSKLYVGRCREYLRSPPPLDWDGVYRMTTK
ncbi:MAG: CHASE2 domain-containing protein [bacterium]